MKKNLPDNQRDFLLYTGKDGKVSIEVFLKNETVWLSQKAMGQFFGVESYTITYHLKEIYKTAELDEKATTRKIRVVQQEGSRQVQRELDFYNLDAIISVGYRVNSYQATQFRIWATRALKEYIIKGFVLDDERLKQGKEVFGKDYFDELLERIREIRASERQFYQKITDIYATSIDYSLKAEDTKQLFATVQNKLHFAITGQTAAEIVAKRADSTKPNMGMTSWRKAPTGKILPADISVAKNYLDKPEIDHLNRIVTMYLDYAELQTIRNKPMYMKDWIEKLNAFLMFSEYEILTKAGNISHEVALSLAGKEYEKYRVTQDKNYISDFDKEVRRITGKKDDSK